MSMAHRQPPQHQLSHQVAKTTTAVTIGGSFMVLSGLTMTATVLLLVVATPLMVIFSPAALTGFLILSGFLASGGFGAMAALVFYWMYKYAAGKQPIGADQLDRVRQRIAVELKDRTEQFGQQQGGKST